MNQIKSVPPAEDHGAIEEILQDIFFVTGSIVMKSPLPMRLSRNMTIIRQDGTLTLVNSVRLNDNGLAALEALGTVEHVIRLAAFHGMDDPFYKSRYDATVWSVDAAYVAGFGGPGQEASYLQPDVVLDAGTDLPLRDARFIEFTSARPHEGLLLLQRDGGIIVSGDCLQNWATTNRYFNLPAKVVMRLMGFIKPHNIGPGWLKAAKPDPAEVRSLLEIDFDTVLPAHGSPVIGNAKSLYAPAIDRL